MTRELSRVAADRLASAPVPRQRYGLSVFLRKAYPAAGNWQSETGNWQPIIRGAEVRPVAWDDLPGDVFELVRRRALEDPYVAAHVLAASSVPTVDVRESGELALDSSLSSALVLRVGRGVTVTVCESPESASLRGSRSPGAGAAEVQSHLVLLLLGAGARVRWFRPSVGRHGFSMVERLALLAQDAVLEYHSALVASNAIRENIHVVLQEPGATTRVGTLFMGSADHQFDLGVTAEHRAPRTTSDLRAKGVLTGKAQAVIRGLIRVENGARGSDGYQRCDALLLSKTAEVDPIPTLEIETNDVRCTHGVTVSRVNAEQMFYLQSRGLSEAAARDLLIEGFAGSLLRSYPERQRGELKTAMQNVLRPGP